MSRSACDCGALRNDAVSYTCLDFVCQQPGEAAERKEAGEQKDKGRFSPRMRRVSQVGPLLWQRSVQHGPNGPQDVNRSYDQGSPTG